MEIVYYAAIGIAAGILSGFMGVGGGIVIIPLLVLLLGYDQLRAQGTSLGVLILPIGLLGFLQYYRNPAVQVSMLAVACIATTFVVGAYFGGRWANQLDPTLLRRIFAVFLLANGTYMLIRR